MKYCFQYSFSSRETYSFIAEFDLIEGGESLIACSEGHWIDGTFDEIVIDSIYPDNSLHPILFNLWITGNRSAIEKKLKEYLYKNKESDMLKNSQ